VRKFLVVDDEPGYRYYLTLLLEREGHQVAVAHDGRSAIAVGSEFKPDVLIVDWMLQNHMSGFEVAAALRDSEQNLETILITGFPSTELRRKAADDRFSAVLEKPFGIREIREAISHEGAA